MLGWLVDHDIEPHIPVWDKGKRRDGTFSREDFVFDIGLNVYTCPNGKRLRTTGTVHDGKTLRYRARIADCTGCPLKPRCCPNTQARYIPRDINEAARDYTRSLMDTEPYRRSARERKRIETRFGDLKWNLGLTRLRLRGITGAGDEFHLAATVQNLWKLAKLIARSPPRPLFA